MELFKFTNGNKITRYTNARRDFKDRDDDIWTSTFIERDFIDINTFNGNLSINVSIKNDLVQPYKLFNNNSYVKVEIYSIGDYLIAPENDDYKVYAINSEDMSEQKINKIYDGNINTVEFKIDKGISIIKCEIFSGKFKSKIPNQFFSSNCPFNIYGKECGLNKDLYTTEIDKSLGSFTLNRRRYTNSDLGNVINILKFRRGSLKITNLDGSVEYSFISKINDVDNYLILLYPIITEDINIDKVEIIQGCDKTLSDCDYKGNVIRFGGFPTIPIDNPAKGI